MNSRDQGLTVGELTIAIAALLITLIAWSSFTRKNDSSKNPAHIQPPFEKVTTKQIL